MPFTPQGLFYAASTRHGYADRPDGRQVVSSGTGGYMVKGKATVKSSLIPRKPRPRISLAKHQAAMREQHALHLEAIRNLRSVLDRTIGEFKTEIMVSKIFRDGMRAMQADQNKAATNIRYAHSNIRAGNLEEAGKYIEEARRDLCII